MPTWRLVAGETADAGCQHHDEHGASSDCRARHARKSTLQRILFPRLLERSLQAEHHISESSEYILCGCRCSLLHIAKDCIDVGGCCVPSGCTNRTCEAAAADACAEILTTGRLLGQTLRRSAGAGCAWCRNCDAEGRLNWPGTSGHAQPPGRNCKPEEKFMVDVCKRLAHPCGAGKAAGQQISPCSAAIHT